MSHDTNDMKRTILPRFGADDRIEGLDVDVTMGALKLLAPAAVAGFLAFTWLSGLLTGALPDPLGHPLVELAVAGALAALIPLAAVALVHVTPRGRTPVGWVARLGAFAREPRERTALDGSTDATRTLTHLRRFDPDSQSVERVDGTRVGGVAVSPAHLSLASEEEWETAASSLGSVFNALEFDVTIRTTARRIDPDAVAAPYEVRLDDPDVQENDALARAVDMYATQWVDELNFRKTAEREYQILVPVGVRDVQLGDRGPLSELRTLPVVGGVYETIAGEASGMDDTEVRVAQAAELESRIDDVQTALAGVAETDCRRLSADDLARLMEEHWRGRRTEYDGADADATGRIRANSVVTGPSGRGDGVDAEADGGSVGGR